MIHTKLEWHDLQATVGLGHFSPAGGYIAECHAMIKINAPFATAKEQYLLLEKAVQRVMQLPELKKKSLVRKVFFVSDAINQAPYLKASANETVSIVQQPPLNGSKASLWLYFVENAQVIHEADGTMVMQRPDYLHLFSTQLHERSVVAGKSPLMPLPASIEHQTSQIFERYIQTLARYNCTLAQNCVRTWIYVQDVDVQYAGMVTARRNYFEKEGLTPQTHYIASTGIEGRYIHPDVLMLMDAYAVKGIKQEQIRHLQALTHLNPTYEYGVTFERGTAIEYGDRCHIFISGTASIDNRGEIVHPMDIEKQTARTFENIQALLAEANAKMSDVASMIVYLRDTADTAIVERYLETHYSTTPYVMVLAPVCRPGWLVEVECIAIKSVSNKLYASF
jgi:enamine deaminase RidA (YjgF/YER057c/UK114 family)